MTLVKIGLNHSTSQFSDAYFVSQVVSFEQSGLCFLGFRNMLVFQSRLSALRPTPNNLGGPIGLLLSLVIHHGPVWHGKPYQ